MSTRNCISAFAIAMLLFNGPQSKRKTPNISPSTRSSRFKMISLITTSVFFILLVESII